MDLSIGELSSLGPWFSTLERARNMVGSIQVNLAGYVFYHPNSTKLNPGYRSHKSNTIVIITNTSMNIVVINKNILKDNNCLFTSKSQRKMARRQQYDEHDRMTLPRTPLLRMPLPQTPLP